MEWLRYQTDAFGQKALVGVNFDLLWLPVAAAGIVIAGHILLKLVRRTG